MRFPTDPRAVGGGLESAGAISSRNHSADVAELVDAHGSGPCPGNWVEVRVLSSALAVLGAWLYGGAEGCSGRDLNLRRREHAQEVSRQLAARLPELQSHDLPRARVQFAQSRIGFFSHGPARVVALETDPRDVRVGVVVPVNLHEQRLAPPPHRHNASHQRIIAIRMFVGDHQPQPQLARPRHPRCAAAHDVSPAAPTRHHRERIRASAPCRVRAASNVRRSGRRTRADRLAPAHVANVTSCRHKLEWALYELEPKAIRDSLVSPAAVGVVTLERFHRPSLASSLAYRCPRHDPGLGT
jgi:hypothetical protein